MRTERHKAGYALESRFPDLTQYAAYEGGAVFLAGTTPCYAIIDERTLADFMDEDDDLVVIHVFDDAAERERWLRKNLPGRRTS
jgi:hypothetical protein